MTAATVAAGPAGLGRDRGPHLSTVAGVAVTGALSGLALWALYRNVNAVIGGSALLWGLLFALVPVAPLTAAFVFLDRFRPEPAKLLALAMLWGALGATYISLRLNAWLAAQVGDIHGASARSAVFIAPWVEETAKGAVIFAIVLWRRHRFNAVLAGIAYGGLVGVGFAFTENIVYYGQVFQQVSISAGGSAALHAVEQLFFWRGLAAPFVHPMFTMLTGAGIGIAVRHRQTGVRILAPVAGFCAAVLLHMAYNTIASFATGEGLTAVYVALLLPTLLSLAAGVLLVRHHERAALAARLRDYTVFGWLQPGVVAYITTTSGRRAARRFAKPFGQEQQQRVRQFQRDGIELSVLRDRMVRGVAGGSDTSAEAVLVAKLRTCQRQVMLPGRAGGGGTADELVISRSSW